MTAPTPEVTPPPGVTTVQEVQAGGVQIYACRMTATGQRAGRRRVPTAGASNSGSGRPLWAFEDDLGLV
jgi:hypothetical protein